MYIKVTKNKNGQAYYHLVESYWDKNSKRSRQRTLLALGRVDEGKLDELVAAISRHKEVFTVLELAKNISAADSYILGPLLVLDRMFAYSGIDKTIFNISKQHPKLSFDLRKLIFTMAAMRFVRPSSKLKVYEHWQKR